MSILRTDTLQNAAGTKSVPVSTVVDVNNLVASTGIHFRNRIINGDMRIDQRNNGASVTSGAGSTYFVDRFVVTSTVASKLSAQRSTVAPSGFTNSSLITVVSSYSPTSTDDFRFSQYVEGFNAADFGWGAAGAQSVTLSFWVRASVTGTYAFAVKNSAAIRSYVATYTVSAANTWQYVTITIPGDTTGTWLTDSGIGLQLIWDLGQGSNYNAPTANTWQASNYGRTSGAVSFVSQANGSTFYITGVQLEAGSVATPFERRPYGTELALCQRYYRKNTSLVASSNAGYSHVQWATTMRAQPTVTHDAGSNINVVSVGIDGMYYSVSTTTGFTSTASAEL